jgi:hypothetical protein
LFTLRARHNIYMGKYLTNSRGNDIKTNQLIERNKI